VPQIGWNTFGKLILVLRFVAQTFPHWSTTCVQKELRHLVARLGFFDLYRRSWQELGHRSTVKTSPFVFLSREYVRGNIACGSRFLVFGSSWISCETSCWKYKMFKWADMTRNHNRWNLDLLNAFRVVLKDLLTHPGLSQRTRNQSTFYFTRQKHQMNNTRRS